MQDRFGDGQAHQRLFDHRPVALVGQCDQLRMQLQPVTTEGDAIVRGAEQ